MVPAAVVEMVPVRVVEMVPAAVVEMVPALVVEMVPALVVEIVPALVVEIVPPLENAVTETESVKSTAAKVGLNLFMIRLLVKKVRGWWSAHKNLPAKPFSFGPTVTNSSSFACVFYNGRAKLEFVADCLLSCGI